MRRSIVLNKPVKKGGVITEQNMAFKRPATGINPKRKKELIGRKAMVDIDRDIPLKESMIKWD
jgi:sialic acid synthase SpsE